MKFGEIVKQKREQLGLTQQDLAEKLFVSRQTVCRWENGNRCPDLIMAKKIALVLNIPLDDLVSTQVVQDYVPPKEQSLDISCVKVMLTGIFLLVLGSFLYIIDYGFFMEFSGLCLIAGVIIFVVGLFIPMHMRDPVIDDELPQKICPQCGKKHDFDYPVCPYCNFDYSAKKPLE